MQVFFNRQYKDVNGNILSSNVAFSDVIFVLEDLDASSDVVFRRDSTAKALSLANTESKSNPDKSEEAHDSLAPKISLNGRVIQARTQAMVNISNNIDKLNLSGILNVLDGVVETPGRIVIMTTNHPELLDPALIRPGRIDRHIHMGMMELNDIVAMFQHYCPGCELSEDQKSHLANLLDQKGITPAQVEQLLAEVETAESFLDEMTSRLDLKDVSGGSECPTDVQSESEDSNAP